MVSVSETSPSDRLLAKASLIGVLAEASGAELPCKRLQGLPLWQLLSLAKLIHPCFRFATAYEAASMLLGSPGDYVASLGH